MPADEANRSHTPPAVRKLSERLPTVMRIALAVAAVVPSFVAYLSATSDAEDQAQVVKARADEQAGKVEFAAKTAYDVAVPELERLRAVVARHEAELAALKRSVRAIGRKTSVSVTVTPAAAPAAPAAPAPLPPTLEQAVQQAKGGPPAEPAK